MVHNAYTTPIPATTAAHVGEVEILLDIPLGRTGLRTKVYVH